MQILSHQSAIQSNYENPDAGDGGGGVDGNNGDAAHGVYFPSLANAVWQ